MARLILALSLAILPLFHAHAQVTSCPRQAPGSPVTSPEQLQSQNGALTVDFSLIDSLPGNSFVYFCYIYTDGTQSPTLAVNPGDLLTLNLTDSMTILGPPPGAKPIASHMAGMAWAKPAAHVNPCGDTDMMYSSTNLHFHGLNIPPVCHQDDTINTLLQAGGPSFQYKFRIPKNEPPGLFWYHPHPHGFSETQVLGGASGVIIINGIEQVKPETAGLSQQVMVIRDESIPGTEPAPANAAATPSAAIIATKQLTLNYIPIVQPYTVLPVLTMKPSEKQFWRVANASADSFLDLQVQIAGKGETLELIALDGVPTSTVTQVSDILLPPGGRGEFVMQGPAAGVTAQFVSLPVSTGYGGDVDPLRPLANIIASAKAPVTDHVPAASANAGPKRFDSLISQTPTAQRKLYFSEKDPSTAPLTQFYITVDGQTPTVYSSSNPPAIVTTVGAVEDWVIENRSLEEHAFHIHQLHFLHLQTNGVAETTPMMLDTVRVPHWDGKSSTYPSVKLRMDFRDPDIAGTFVYHCHILEHEDAGMMAKIQVNPAAAKP